MPMFEGWDAVVLARAQFAFTMSFHIVFPAFSIGLASYLAVLEALAISRCSKRSGCGPGAKFSSICSIIG